MKLFFIAVRNKEEDVEALVLSSKTLFQRRGPRGDIANLVIFKLNIGSLKLCMRSFVE